MTDIVIFDTEFTAWEGSQQRGWSEPWEHRELVQISALRIDPRTFDPVSPPLDIIIKPRINVTLSGYFINLTSITNEMVAERGTDIADALAGFRAYSAGATLSSFGNDCAVINENITLYNLADQIAPFTGEDIRQWSLEQGLKIPNSGAFARTVGAPLEVREHYALDDVRSIHAAVRFLVQEKGYQNPFLAHK